MNNPIDYNNYSIEDVKKFYENGDITAANYLGQYYTFTTNGDKNFVKAVYWYTQAAVGGDVLSQYNLGYAYEAGVGVEKNIEKAVGWYTKAADQGDADAQNHLGVYYNNSRDIENSQGKALYWFTKAADQGNSRHQFNLGYFFMNHQNIDNNLEKAIIWYKKAAAQGHEQAAANLEITEDLLRKRMVKTPGNIDLAEQGSLTLFDMAWRYANGDGVEKDSKKAAYWYTKAAEQGDPVAQNNLGVLYEHGEGVTQNKEKAVYWYVKSAKQGYGLAFNNIGALFEHSSDDSAHKSQACFYYEFAARNGYLPAYIFLYNVSLKRKVFNRTSSLYSDYREELEPLYFDPERSNILRKGAFAGLEECKKALRQYIRDCNENSYSGTVENAMEQARNAFQDWKNGNVNSFHIAEEFYNLAAAMGNLNALCMLAYLCESPPSGHLKRFDIALKHYKAAAEMGHSYAMHQVGAYYEYGYAGRVDKQIAQRCYAKAREMGYKDS